MIESRKITKGYVYILINTSYPGLLKIGKSKRSPEIRASELSISTGVPNSFYVAYYLIVSDIDTAEFQIHKYLKEYREVRNREFFRLPLNQAIDLVKKVLFNSNIEFANHEEETYKFKYEEYTSTKEFFNDILNDEDKWEHAKLHLDKGYLIPWLKKKGEIDALINLDVNSSKVEFDNSDYRLSLICFSVIKTPFKFHSIEIKDTQDLLNLINLTDLDNNLNLEIWLKNKLYYKYLGHLNACNQEPDKTLHIIHFVNYNFKKLPEPKLKFIKKIIEWNIKPDDFYKLNQLNEENFKYLYYRWFTENELGVSMDKTMIPMKMSIFYFEGTHTETDTHIFFDIVQKFKRILSKKGYDFKKEENLDDYLKVNMYVPENLNPYYILSFETEECFTILKSLYSKDEIDTINSNHILPEGLYSSLINPDNHESFFLASVLLRLLVFGYKEYIEDGILKEEKFIFRTSSYFLAKTPNVLNKLRENNKKTNKENGLKNKGTLSKKYPWIFLQIIYPVWIHSATTGENLLHSLEYNEQKK